MIPLRDYAGLPSTEIEEIRQIVRAHHGLEDVFAWGRQQVPLVVPTHVLVQDEFTHDVVVPFPRGRYLVYGTT